MKLKGKYRDNQKIGTFPDCTFLLEYGKLHNLIVKLPPINAASYIPKNKSNFEFEKLPSEKGLVPYDYNYVIEYIGKSDTKQKVYLKLNSVQIFKIKWQLKKYLLQDKSLKIDTIKYIIGGLIGSLITVGTQKIIKNNSAPITPPITENKNSFEQTNDQADLKNDFITNSLKINN